MLLQPFKQRVPCYIRSDYTQTKTKPQFIRQFLYDIDCPLQVGRGSGAACTADYQWYAAANRSAQHQGEVSAHGRAIGEGFTGAQVVGTGIRRPGVDRYKVRIVREAALEGRFREAVSQDRGRG